MMTHAELVMRAGKWLRNTRKIPCVLCEVGSAGYELDIKEVSQGCRASDEGVGPALPPSSHHAGPALRYATSVPGVRVVRDPKREVLKGGSREPGQEDC